MVSLASDYCSLPCINQSTDKILRVIEVSDIVAFLFLCGMENRRKYFLPHLIVFQALLFRSEMLAIRTTE